MDSKKKVIKYYDQKAETYAVKNYASNEEYPANRIRLDLIVKLMQERATASVLDVGCGSGFPLKRFLAEGMDAYGFDYSESMVKKATELLESGSRVRLGDLEEHNPFGNAKFDAVTALGVFPHNLDDTKALSTIRKALKPNGRAYIEFRNELFSMFTLNRYTREFYAKLLPSMSDSMYEEAMSVFDGKFDLDAMTPVETGISYGSILARFHNPLSIDTELFRPNGFKVERIHFYHFHALPPYFELSHPQEYRKASLEMEKPNDWRGHLMASAFITEVKPVWDYEHGFD